MHAVIVVANGIAFAPPGATYTNAARNSIGIDSACTRPSKTLKTSRTA
jgi:hypothetical protein